MAKKEEKIVYVDSKGKRQDGRKVNELRPIKIKAEVIPRANGSAYLEWGQNKVLASVMVQENVYQNILQALIKQ